NRSELRNISCNLLLNGQNFFLASIIKTPQSLVNLLTPGVGGSSANVALTGSSNATFGFVNNQNGFVNFLEALCTEGLAKLRDCPYVVTLSGQPAQLVSGGEVPILTSSGTGAPSVTYKDFGTIVRCLPIVMADGKIWLDVAPEVSARDAALDLFISGVTPTSIPGFDKRSAKVTVVMEDG